ncbi:SIS domain-containing protein [Clostridium beijerinckii]|uniref:Phosphosugar isomerase n=1 Tax=Clostridium beijerinckii TaxID=1520 RepID=A0A1S9N2G9_CLOBE|nr:SIS domain-containing protein [Clostridium beijerinckii]OOP71717.1 phosphosugar isomerase [Clostridium beijerinckii]
MNMKNIIEEIIANKKEVGGIKQVYYVACGGSYGAFYPAKTFLETEATDIKVGIYNSNEFVHNTPKAFGKNSVLIVASHKGNTPETVKAAEIGKEAGVPVIALTWITDSPITGQADYVVDYTFGDDKDIAGEKTIVALMTAVEILNQTEGYANYDKFLDGVAKIDRIVKNACKHVEKRALAFAKDHKDDSVIYTMASGAGYGAAYMESICIFMEMQWINSSSIHTGEFFHGPFEITDAEIPFVIQVSEGSTRPLDERALKFLDKYARRVEVIDAKELGLSKIDSSVVDYFNHTLFNNVYPIYNKALADERQHPLTTRRYMWKVEY